MVENSKAEKFYLDEFKSKNLKLNYQLDNIVIEYRDQIFKIVGRSQMLMEKGYFSIVSNTYFGKNFSAIKVLLKYCAAGIKSYLEILNIFVLKLLFPLIFKS